MIEEQEKEMDFPFLSPASSDAVLNEDGTGDHVLLETGDHALLESAVVAAATESRRRLIIAS